MRIVKIFWQRGLGPPIWDIWDSDDEESKNIWVQGDLVLQFGIFGIVMMKIVKIFGPMDVGPPIWDILDSDNEDSENIWAKGTWSSNLVFLGE